MQMQKRSSSGCGNRSNVGPRYHGTGRSRRQSQRPAGTRIRLADVEAEIASIICSSVAALLSRREGHH